MKKIVVVALAIALQMGVSYAFGLQTEWLLSLTGGNLIPLFVGVLASVALFQIALEWMFVGASMVLLITRFFQGSLAFFICALAVIGMPAHHFVQTTGFLLGIFTGVLVIILTLNFYERQTTKA